MNSLLKSDLLLVFLWSPGTFGNLSEEGFVGSWNDPCSHVKCQHMDTILSFKSVMLQTGAFVKSTFIILDLLHKSHRIDTTVKIFKAVIIHVCSLCQQFPGYFAKLRITQFLALLSGGESSDGDYFAMN